MRKIIRITSVVLTASFAMSVTGCFGYSPIAPDKLAAAAEELDAEHYDDANEFIEDAGGSSMSDNRNYGYSNASNECYLTLEGKDIRRLMENSASESYYYMNEILSSTDSGWNAGDVTYDDFDSMESLTYYVNNSVSLAGTSYCYVTSISFDSDDAAKDYYNFQTKFSKRAVNIFNMDELQDEEMGSMFKVVTDEDSKSGVDYFVFSVGINNFDMVENHAYGGLALIMIDGKNVMSCMVLEIGTTKGSRTLDKLLKELDIFELNDILDK